MQHVYETTSNKRKSRGIRCLANHPLLLPLTQTFITHLPLQLILRIRLYHQYLFDVIGQLYVKVLLKPSCSGRQLFRFSLLNIHVARKRQPVSFQIYGLLTKDPFRNWKRTEEFQQLLRTPSAFDSCCFRFYFSFSSRVYFRLIPLRF